MNLLIRTLIVSICILFYVSYLHAQTNYYTTTKTFNDSGYTYQCDIPHITWLYFTIRVIQVLVKWMK